MDAKLRCVFEMPPMEDNAENNSGSGAAVVSGAGSASAGGSVGTNAPASLSSGEALKSDVTVSSAPMVCVWDHTDKDLQLIYIYTCLITEYDRCGICRSPGE